MNGRIKKDITIRFIPNILVDEGRTMQSFSFDRRWTIRKYLKKSKVNFEGMRITVNGNEVKSLKKHLQSGDEIMVSPNVEFEAVLGIFGPFWGGVGAILDIIYLVASVAYGIYSAVTTKVKTPSYDTLGDGLDEGSPSASWTGVKTNRDPNGSIPIIYGKRLTGGTIINEFITTDGEKNYLNSLVGIAEGPVKSITLSRINKNAATNFSNYTRESRLGTIDQTPIPNFEDLHDIHSLNVRLDQNDPYVYTTQISDLEAFEVIFRLPIGLYQQDGSGNISSWAATFRIEYKLHTDGSYTDLGETTISAKTNSTIQKIFRKVALTAGQYDIRITKTSADPSDLSYPMTVGELYLTGVDEINTDDLAYPCTATDGLKTLAVDELSGDDPQYEYLIEGKLILVPQVICGSAEVDWEGYYWDPVASCYKLFADNSVCTWDGVTYVERYCANPIWCLYDLMTNTRYGAGDYIGSGDHDLDFLLEMSQYCDERVPDGEGGYEKRFRMDICIDSPQGALELIMQLSGIFKGMPFFSDYGRIRIAIDKPSDPVQLFNMNNIIKDSFSQTWGSKRDVPNIVQVQFDNEDNYYEQDMISVIDEESLAAGDPKRIKQVRYYGTKISYAIRFGRDIIKTAKYVNRTISMKSGIGAFIRQCGEVIDIAHDVPQWGFSGGVKIGSTTTKVKLDRTVEIETSKSYAIRVDFAECNIDGSPRYEERVITDPPGSYTEVTVDSAFTVAPVKNDSYVFGELNKLVLPARIVSLKRERSGDVEMQAQEYNEDIYDETAVVIPVRKLSSLSTGIPDVEGLSLTEALTLAKDGTIKNVINVWFAKPNLTSYRVRRLQKVKIYLSDNAGASWEYMGETYSDSYAIEKVLPEGIEYTVAVVSVSNDNETKAITTSPQATIQLIGKTAPPQDVPSFLINQSRDRLYMGWTKITDVDLRGYEIRYGIDWATGDAIASDLKSTSLIRLDFRTGDNQSFWIKAIDTSGNYSINATEAIISVQTIPFTNIIETYLEQTGWAGAKTNLSKVGDNLEIDSGYLTGTYLTPVRDLGYVATFKVGIEAVIVDASSEDRMNDSETERMNDSETERMSGRELTGATTFEIRFSEDGPDPDTWTAWQPWQPGDYKCRWLQIRMTLSRASEAIVVQCSQLNYYADLPDVDEWGEAAVLDANAGIQVVFTKEYHKVPGVAPQVLSGDGRVVVFTAEPDLTDFTAKLYDLSGVAKTGRFSYNVHGV